MKYFPRLVLALSLFAALSAAASAQTQISDEKNKLIAELAGVMKLDQQFPEMVDAMLKEMEKTYPLGFSATIDSNGALTAEQKTALRATARERFIAFSQKFRKRLSEQIDYGKYIQEAVYPLYDKFYNEQELKDLISFYKTATGQKMIKSLPAILAESTKMATEKFVPKVLPIVQELLKEEFEQIAAPPKSQIN